MKAKGVLVIDDDTDLREAIAANLTDKGYEVLGLSTVAEAVSILSQGDIAVVLIDIGLPGEESLQRLENIWKHSPNTEVLVMTAQVSVDSVITAVRLGAYDYLRKPFKDIEEVCLRVQRAHEKRELALKNRLLVEEQKQRNRELSAAVVRLSSMLDAGRALGEFSSLPQLLDSFLGLVVKELKVERVSLMMLDEKTQTLSIAASRGLEKLNVKKVRVPVGKGIAGQVAESGTPILVTDADKDPRVNHRVKPHLSDSFICAPIAMGIPIKFQDHVLGVISITNRKSEKPFNKKDLAYLSSLSGQLAVAIERTRHFEDLQKAYETLKSTQDQLVRSERVKAVGQMAAGVAHDFNNALSGILGNAEILLQKSESGPLDPGDVKRALETIKALSLQASESIKRVQNFTRVNTDKPDQALNMNDLVREAVDMTRPKWKDQCEKEGGEIVIAFDLGEIADVSGNSRELTQLISNLIFNAVEAMPEGGKLTFETRQEGPWVITEVKDTGMGMSEEVQQRLFEPFFTTKEAGQGLGTSIVYSIAARHGGEVSANSQEGKGSTFRLKLPVFQGPRDKAQAEDQAAENSRTPARILYVEDDEIARKTYREYLITCGHEVAVAPTGKQALTLFGKGKFDLVITDLSMPGMSGLEVAKAVKEVDREVPVVLLSGWAFQQSEEGAREAGVDSVLAKPCLLEDLRKVVQETTQKWTVEPRVGGRG